jgi:hypothetical protein
MRLAFAPGAVDGGNLRLERGRWMRIAGAMRSRQPGHGA